MGKNYILKRKYDTSYKLKIKKAEININTVIERYCTVEESLVESLKQMKAIRKGELTVKTWDEFKKELQGIGIRE